MGPVAFQLLHPVDTSLSIEPLVESFPLLTRSPCPQDVALVLLHPFWIGLLKVIGYFHFLKLFGMPFLTLHASSSIVPTPLSDAVGFGKMWGVGDIHSQ